MKAAREWIVRPRPVVSPRVRLFCFPHAGGNGSVFKDWPTGMPEDVEVCVVELPGRGRRLSQPPLTNMNQILEALTEGGYPYKETRVAVFGHSFGALLAFEFARRLGAMNIHLIHLFVSGQAAPQLPDPEPPMGYLSDPEFISEMIRRYDGIPAEILREEEMMQLLLPVLRADMMMKETYQYQYGSLLKCPISAFGGHDDSSTTIDELAAWGDQTTGPFKLRTLPGTHFFINTARNDLLRAVAEDLECSLRGVSSKLLPVDLS